MVREPVNKKRHLVALTLTGLIFIIGILIGYSINGARINYIQSIGKEQRLEYDSLQLQSLYVRSLLEEENCEAIGKALDRNIDTLEKTRARIETFIKDAEKKDDYNLLKREYTLEQLQYWLLARETKSRCKENVVLVLYFYSNEDECEDCRTQGAILTTLKNKFNEKVLIFAIDAGFIDEPMVEILKESFNVRYAPTILVEKQKFEGFTEQKSIIEEICKQLGNDAEVCNGEL